MLAEVEAAGGLNWRNLNGNCDEITEAECRQN